MSEEKSDQAVPIDLIGPESLDQCFARLSAPQRQFAQASGFKAEPGRITLLPDESGQIDRVLFGLGELGSADRTPFAPGALGKALPTGQFQLTAGSDNDRLAALACRLGAYQFDRYRKNSKVAATILPADGIDDLELKQISDASFLARDLINTPANDLGPAELADVAKLLAEEFGASISVHDGDDLATGFPMIHAVGDASDRRPCLIDMVWGPDSAPKVTLVGKGIIFDTGGLDLKPASAMLLMKKDMGGAAGVLGLARLVMARELNIRLRVLIPAAENAVSGSAFRPGDILKSRKGLSVEIGNTDAEGRLVLADALTLAEEEEPDLLISMATLTGAARVAMGPDIPPFYVHDDDLAASIMAAGEAEYDPVWRLPLWAPYDKGLKSNVADFNNVTKGGFGGSITAALFLNRFVAPTTRYAHFDIYGWNPAPKPACPEGGEAQAMRALYRHLEEAYGQS